MTREELDKVLENHQHWLREDVEGWQNMRANLWGADLRGANLRGANLEGANLRGADLREANLREANLEGADLRGADLREANLREANLRGADLRGADLREADLRGADLRGADLREANLRGADLRGADLRGAKGIPYIPIACPDEGAFIGWKKCRRHGNKGGSVIVKLCIPEDARRTSSTGRKCRCDKAVVLEIQDIGGTLIDEREEPSGCAAFSAYDETFEYKVGETVTPKEPYDECRWNECGSGIHFFINRQEAVNY